MHEDTIITCPHCGASISVHGFNIICEYCGTRLYSDLINVINPNYDSLSDVRKRNEYLITNEHYIKSSKHISMIESNGEFELTSSSSFYTNDGNYRLLDNLSINLRYINKIQSDNLSIIAKTSNDIAAISQISILFDVDNLITPIFETSEGNISFFRISFNEIKAICDSRIIAVETNNKSLMTGYFNEFIPFCRRFYNLAFNKNKYSYSLYQNLILDHYGK